MSRLDGKVAIITGGVKGFGLACAKLFVREGAKVVITDVDVAGASEALQEIGEDKAVFVKQDVAVEDNWEPVFRTAIDKFEKVDILVNNAGILAFDDAENIELDEWHKILSVNLDGIMLGVKYGIRHMKEKGGSIINMASIAGLIGISNLYAYNASKGGVRLLTNSAALYCAAKHSPT
ncbi:SDR family NAD(P)-dependent oxidoreductase, partial [Pediococcus acidilactici]|nr:SDR family NAD(P)-dependent oxidoreductase [Pediococcus acidilactici]